MEKSWKLLAFCHCSGFGDRDVPKRRLPAMDGVSGAVPAAASTHGTESLELPAFRNRNIRRVKASASGVRRFHIPPRHKICQLPLRRAANSHIPPHRHKICQLPLRRAANSHVSSPTARKRNTAQQHPFFPQKNYPFTAPDIPST